MTDPVTVANGLSLEARNLLCGGKGGFKQAFELLEHGLIEEEMRDITGRGWRNMVTPLGLAVRQYLQEQSNG